ncbi:MAG: hypothetical protein K0U12_07680 [Gammaproteobacteria bacterium]|nr:hypothetical protein [Gammaproteobacteria bacterium]
MQEQQPLITPNKTINLGEILSKSWELVDGIKWPIWATFLVLIVAAFIIMSLLNWFFGIKPGHPPTLTYDILSPIILNAITAPLYAGALMVSIKKARHEEVNPNSGFQYFNKYVPLAIVLVIVGIIMRIPMLLVNVSTSGTMVPGKIWIEIIAGIITLVIFAFLLLSTPLVADKNTSIGHALSTSIKVACQQMNWLKISVLLLVSYIIIFAIMVPLLLGIILHNALVMILGFAILVVAGIWVVPYLISIVGMIYHRLID